jgi:iron(III) transport system ATP-binding protein
MVRGRVTRAGGSATFDSGALGSIVLPGAAAAGDADIAIRPHALQLAVPGAALEPVRVWIEGIVNTREFLGEFVRYVVALNGAELIVDETHFADRVTFTPGDPVRVGIDPARAKLFAA